MERSVIKCVAGLIVIFNVVACSSRSTEVVVVNEPTKENIYSVGGSTIAEVLASINSQMSGGFAGYAGVDIYYQYEVNSSVFRDCSVKKITITTKPYMRIPDWRSSGSFDANMLPNWLRYIQALRVHEDGHIEIGLAAARTFASKFEYPNVVKAKNCSDLDEVVKSVYKSDMANAWQENIRYDKLTGHGVTQGTNIAWN